MGFDPSGLDLFTPLALNTLIMATTRGWLVVDKSMVHRRLTASEIDRLQTVQIDPGEALASDQGVAISLGEEALGIGATLEDPLAETIQEVVDKMRGDIASAGRDFVMNDDVTTLPASLVGDALAIIVVRLSSRLGGQVIDADEVRMKFYEEAMETCDRIRRGDQAIPEATSGNFQSPGWLLESRNKPIKFGADT